MAEQDGIRLTKENEAALELIGDILVRIRFLARQPATPERTQLIHDLADSMHNTPGFIAGGRHDEFTVNFIDREVQRGKELMDASETSRHTSTAISHGQNSRPSSLIMAAFLWTFRKRREKP